MYPDHRQCIDDTPACKTTYSYQCGLPGVKEMCPCLCKVPTRDKFDNRCTYIVQVGDTYDSIAERYCLIGKDIEKINPGPAASLSPGQVLKVPCEKPNPCPGSPVCVYTVKPGETISDVAKYTCMEVQSLLVINPNITLLSTLKPGDLVRVPCKTMAECDKVYFNTTDNQPCVMTARKGQTPQKIAKAYCMQVGELLDINRGLTADQKLEPGKQLYVPCSTKNTCHRNQTEPFCKWVVGHGGRCGKGTDRSCCMEGGYQADECTAVPA